MGSPTSDAAKRARLRAAMTRAKQAQRGVASDARAAASSIAGRRSKIASNFNAFGDMARKTLGMKPKPGTMSQLGKRK